MVAIASTVACEGIEARMVEVQCTIAPGIPAFAIVGLPDKAVTEARERVRAAVPAAMAAAGENRQLLCPQACGAEAAWVGDARVIAQRSLADMIQYLMLNLSSPYRNQTRSSTVIRPATWLKSKGKNGPNGR